ncbi:MAG: hypothetical protein WD060_13455 [Pirellulales bacterium]
MGITRRTILRAGVAGAATASLVPAGERGRQLRRLGLEQGKTGTTGAEPLYGKQWACEQLGRELPYDSFDRGGWHIVLLDSVFPHEQSYVGKLDDAQWDWLERDLTAVPAATPVLVVSHIPFLSVYPLAAAATNGSVGSDGKPAFSLSGGLVHVDHDRFQKLFARHRNVKACLSGHLHETRFADPLSSFSGLPRRRSRQPRRAQSACPARRQSDSPHQGVIQR